MHFIKIFVEYLVLSKMGLTNSVNNCNVTNFGVNIRELISRFEATPSQVSLKVNHCFLFSYLWTQSGVALLRGISGEPLWISRKSMPKMATWDLGKLRVETWGLYGLRSWYQVSGQILFKHERTVAVRHEFDKSQT